MSDFYHNICGSDEQGHLTGQKDECDKITMEWQTTKAQTNKKKEKETKRNKTAGKEKKARPVCQCSFLKCYYCKLTAQKVPVYKADEAIVIDIHSLIQERTHNFSCFEWRSNTPFLKKKN